MRLEKHASTSRRTERIVVKASVRKRAQQLLENLPSSPTLERLREEFQEKGFLSKRELKELQTLKNESTQAA